MSEYVADHSISNLDVAGHSLSPDLEEYLQPGENGARLDLHQLRYQLIRINARQSLLHAIA